MDKVLWAPEFGEWTGSECTRRIRGAARGPQAIQRDTLRYKVVSVLASVRFQFLAPCCMLLPSSDMVGLGSELQKQRVVRFDSSWCFSLHNWMEVSEIALKGQCSAIELPARIAPDNAAAALSALRHEGFSPNDTTRCMVVNRKRRANSTAASRCPL